MKKLISPTQSRPRAMSVSAANMGPYHYRYEVHWVSPSGDDKLLGGTGTIESAENIAKRMINEIFSSPWESNKNKILFIENTYLWDTEEDEDVTTDELADFIDLMKSRIAKKGE